MTTLHHVGLSGGKDSTALWGWILNESGLDPATVRGSFADTGNEYAETYEQIRLLSLYGVSKGAPPIKTLRTMGFLKLCIKKKRFPGAKSRFCTEELKMVPSRKYIRLLQRKHTVIGYTGVRANESAERAKLAEEDFSTYYGVLIKRPLLDWEIAEVWQAHDQYRLPINPLYKQGRYRVGCRLCCMSNKRDVRVTAETRPDVIAVYRRWEKIVAKGRWGEVASFFKSTTVPEQFRSRKWVNREGVTFMIPTIDDVVLWSKTLYGGRQFGLDFMFDDYDDGYDKGLSCKSAMGSCE